MKAQDLIKKKPHLVWYTKKVDTLSDEAVVEAILNYGDFDDVQKLNKILGIKKVAAIFRKQIRNPRCNYDLKIKNYFTLYFDKYAKENRKVKKKR
jgi:hypothetical protein